jgi:hypothetical protein
MNTEEVGVKLLKASTFAVTVLQDKNKTYMSCAEILEHGEKMKLKLKTTSDYPREDVLRLSLTKSILFRTNEHDKSTFKLSTEGIKWKQSTPKQPTNITKRLTIIAFVKKVFVLAGNIYMTCEEILAKVRELAIEKETKKGAITAFQICNAIKVNGLVFDKQISKNGTTFRLSDVGLESIETEVTSTPQQVLTTTTEEKNSTKRKFDQVGEEPLNDKRPKTNALRELPEFTIVYPVSDDE